MIAVLLEQLNKLNKDIERILKDSQYESNGDLSAYDIDVPDENDLFMKEKLYEIMEHLASVNTNLNYLARPIKEEGKLQLKQNGRYSFPSGRELTCGCGIEILIDDGTYDIPYWTYDRIEAENGVYYLWNHDKLQIDGLLARIR